MLTNSDSDTIVISAGLRERAPKVMRGLLEIFAATGARHVILKETKDIWCRDLFPVQTEIGRFVYYRYSPSYLADEPDRITRISSGYGDRCANIHLTMKLDGGNIERGRSHATGRGYVLMTDRFLSENEQIPRAEQLARLRRAFGKVYLFPSDPEDMFGHIDGMLRVIGSTAFLCDLSYDRTLKRAFMPALSAFTRSEGITNVVRLPYTPAEDPLSAIGNYVNFLTWGKILVMPTYGIAHDRQARALIAAALPHFTIYTLDCRAIAKDGGVLNCVTGQYRSRFLRSA